MHSLQYGNQSVVHFMSFTLSNTTNYLKSRFSFKNYWTPWTYSNHISSLFFKFVLYKEAELHLPWRYHKTKLITLVPPTLAPLPPEKCLCPKTTMASHIPTCQDQCHKEALCLGLHAPPQKQRETGGPQEPLPLRIAKTLAAATTITDTHNPTFQTPSQSWLMGTLAGTAGQPLCCHSASGSALSLTLSLSQLKPVSQSRRGHCSPKFVQASLQGYTKHEKAKEYNTIRETQIYGS